MIDVKEQKIYNLRKEYSGRRVEIVKLSGVSILAMSEAQSGV